jgi:DNA-binding LytR/AlgR family response regulator
MASSIIIIGGMMPTLAANLMDKSRQKSRAISVGMMNFAGCMPFLLELWMSPAPNSIDTATAIMLQPKTIVIIYSIAGAGYAIEAAITGMVATMMQQRAAIRLKEIDNQLKELVDRWNTYVDGNTALDDFGFPAED